MVEADEHARFEQRLGRMFGDSPAYPDASVFAEAVEGRLAQGAMVRTMLITALGVVGGVVGVGQLLKASFFTQFEAAATGSGQRLAGLAPDLGALGGALTGALHDGVATMPIGSQSLWMAALLGAVALAFGVARAVEEL